MIETKQLKKIIRKHFKKEENSYLFEVLKDRLKLSNLIILYSILGESLFLRYIDKISVDDFNLYTRNLKNTNSIQNSALYKTIYMDIVGREQCIQDLITLGDVEVRIEIPIYLNEYRMQFVVPERTISIVEGIIDIKGERL